MSDDRSTIGHILYSLIKTGDLDKIEDFFAQHPEGLDPQLLRDALKSSLSLHSETMDLEAVANFLVL